MFFDLLDIIYTEKLVCTTDDLDNLAEKATDIELEIVNDYVFNDRQQEKALELINQYRCK